MAKLPEMAKESVTPGLKTEYSVNEPIDHSQ